MKHSTRMQLVVFGIFLVMYAALAFSAYLLTPLDQLVAPGQSIPAQTLSMPRWQMAAGSAVFILVGYGLLGLAGIWFARKLELPAMYREGAGWRSWLLWPMLLGLAVGVVLVVMDQVLARLGSSTGFPHPAFPLSVIASAAAGIGEEILFRGFVLGLWSLLFSLLLRRWKGRQLALWIGNGIAALAFAAAHLPAAMILFRVATPAAIPALTLVELFLLNSCLGLVAGERYMRDGLAAAMGLHFWADMVWHVLWPVMALGM
jgi:membrane protease YdiL (CAAX protease family)